MIRIFAALAAILTLSQNAQAQGCVGVRAGGCSGVTVQVGGCSGIMAGGCSGVVMVNAGCMGMLPVVSNGCGGGVGRARVVGILRVAQAPRVNPLGVRSEVPDARFAVIETPRRLFGRVFGLPAHRAAVRID